MSDANKCFALDYAGSKVYLKDFYLCSDCLDNTEVIFSFIRAIISANAVHSVPECLYAPIKQATTAPELEGSRCLYRVIQLDHFTNLCDKDCKHDCRCQQTINYDDRSTFWNWEFDESLQECGPRLTWVQVVLTLTDEVASKIVYQNNKENSMKVFADTMMDRKDERSIILAPGRYIVTVHRAFSVQNVKDSWCRAVRAGMCGQDVEDAPLCTLPYATDYSD